VWVGAYLGMSMTRLFTPGWGVDWNIQSYVGFPWVWPKSSGRGEGGE
jgi:hypothetical protein